MFCTFGNNPVTYTDPDGRETYGSNITEDEFNKIQYALIPPSSNTLDSRNPVSWEDVQNFFAKNPNGCIYRNPDELVYGFYTNKEKDKPVEYNVFTTTELDLLLFGKGLVKFVKNLGSNTVGEVSKHGVERISGKAATRGGCLTAKEIIKTRNHAQFMYKSMKNGAVISVTKNSNNTYNLVIDGKRGLITSLKGISEKAFTRLSRNYEYILIK